MKELIINQKDILKNPETERLSMEGLKQRLTIEEGLQFISPEQYKIPSAFNFNALESVGLPEEHIREAVGLMLDFLASPMIKDQFGGDQDGRRKRRKEVIQKYTDLGYGPEIKWIFDHNRLRGQKGVLSMVNFFNVWAAIAQLNKVDNPASQKLQSLLKALPKPEEILLSEEEEKENFKKIREAGISGGREYLLKLIKGKDPASQYNILPIEKKEEFVKKVENIILDFLNFIALNQTGQPKEAHN